ncbi:hypothetical protein BDV28DRAFT_137020 [Aspergillus coremiiformis]|uniref:RING-type domain-containing protein n=1 Tax=Aspergillus coremiiformis TaxID=138285 RepID=A0A5N6Z1D8_9EURO|nr:hypothetical protein BDV28DRAFT_137020 [Aspergillus coremiiformis]
MSKSTLARAAPGRDSNNTNATLGDDISGLFQTLQGHVDDIRALLQCGICMRPLYEPFTLACGHTFCYSCLTSWFAGGRSNKTCPDCRTSVKTQPAPAYLVRAVVQLFTSRAELLEKGETTAEHTRHQREEAIKLENDKKNTHPKEGGLFRGTFNKKPPAAQPIVDLEDNVVRCPRCSWELEEDSNCAQCGYRHDVDSVTDTSDYLSDSEENSEMTDYLDDDLEDGFGDVDDVEWNDFYDGIPIQALAFDLPHHLFNLHRHHNHTHHHQNTPHQHPLFPRDRHYEEGSSVTDDSEEEDDYLEDTDMDSFIDDDEHIDGGHDYDSESDRSTVVGGPDFHTQDHYEEQLSSEVTTMSHIDDYIDDAMNGLDEVPDSEEDGEEDDEEPIRPPVNGNRRRPVPGHNEISRSSAPWNRVPSQPNVDPYAIRRQLARTQTTSTPGTSVSNAINVDEDSDEGPVRPFRRNCRHAAR